LAAKVDVSSIGFELEHDFHCAIETCVHTCSFGAHDGVWRIRDNLQTITVAPPRAGNMFHHLSLRFLLVFAFNCYTWVTLDHLLKPLHRGSFKPTMCPHPVSLAFRAVKQDRSRRNF
jgi:hypothetical protein